MHHLCKEETTASMRWRPSCCLIICWRVKRCDPWTSEWFKSWAWATCIYRKTAKEISFALLLLDKECPMHQSIKIGDDMSNPISRWSWAPPLTERTPTAKTDRWKPCTDQKLSWLAVGHPVQPVKYLMQN